MRRMVQALSLALAAGVASADVVVRDTISTNTWRNQPSWGVSAQNDSFRDWPALTFTGNGRKLTRFAVIAMFTDADGNWNPPGLSDVNFDVELGFFASFTDWLSDPDRLTATIGAPSNANWLTPVATYGGIKYHYLEFDLSGRSLPTTSGVTHLISVTVNPNGSFSNALGYLAAGVDGRTDYLHRIPPGPSWTGTLLGFYSQYGSSITNVAATVWLESPPCPADLNADTFVDDSDFVLFAAAYNLLLCSDPAMPSACPADLDRDGFVDDTDFVTFAAAYNELICP